MKTTETLLLLAIAFSYAMTADADTFGSGPNSFDIEFVTVGDLGNSADTTGFPNPAGAVPYEYRIGMYEVSEDMIDKANAEGGLGITKDTRGPDKPATSINWFEAAQFVNWLNTDAGSTPAYKFLGDVVFQLWEPGDVGYNPENPYRNSQAVYFLPSIDEWYKAAYYDPTGVYYDYPTGSDIEPLSVANGTTANTAVYLQSVPAGISQAGGLSPYGTMGQGGNASEWQETVYDLDHGAAFLSRSFRGGTWGDGTSLLLQSSSLLSASSSTEFASLGFRVASVAVPEPTSAVLGIIVGVSLAMNRIKITKDSQGRKRGQDSFV